MENLSGYDWPPKPTEAQRAYDFWLGQVLTVAGDAAADALVGEIIEATEDGPYRTSLLRTLATVRAQHQTPGGA